jgi:DNA anti-recombination protein RmuC
MHVHACQGAGVRTTVEITDEQRAALLELAARRGDKGFSRLVQEAIDRYLADEGTRKERVEAALALGASMSEKASQSLEESVRRVRGTWR